jgi:hypothetical protein
VSTPWWYPSQTGGGELRADRLVFPIMPGVSWREVRAVEVGVDSGQLTVASADGGEAVASDEWPVASADGAVEGAGGAGSSSAAVAEGARGQLATVH